MSVCRVPQLMEVTGKNQDECMVALHDCNEDVSRAINFLLESTSDMVTDILSYSLSSHTTGLVAQHICHRCVNDCCTPSKGRPAAVRDVSL